jgi:dihydroorotate dehydrogenase electron transfer subunit
MKIEQGRVLEHGEFAAGYRIMTFEAPAIAPLVKAGQFIHLRIPELDGSVLRRPFSIFNAEGPTLSMLYKQVGKGTLAMQRIRPGDEVSLMGPLGNGFPAPHKDIYPVIVAGGYGVAPLHCLAVKSSVKGLALVGGASAGDVLCVDQFREAGWETRVATDDGSLGAKGFVTVLLDAWLAESSPGLKAEIYACGPVAMLRAVGARAMAGGFKGWLSLEKRLGCGVGACLACVQRIRREDGSIAWARVCSEGPIFEARQVVWEVR